MYTYVNGFSPEDYGSPLLATYTVPGTSVRVSLRKEVAPLLLAFMRDWNAEVETLDPAQVWGHAYREVRGSTLTSFHAPAIAVDLNAEKHPLGEHPTFTDAQVAAARRVLARYVFEGVRLLRWGYDYDGRKDDMHVEIVASRSLTLRAVAALQANPKTKTTEDDMLPEERQDLADRTAQAIAEKERDATHRWTGEYHANQLGTISSQLTAMGDTLTAMNHTLADIAAALTPKEPIQ